MLITSELNPLMASAKEPIEVISAVNETIVLFVHKVIRKMCCLKFMAKIGYAVKIHCI